MANAKLVRQADGTFKLVTPEVKKKADGTPSTKAPNENTVIWIYKADIMALYAKLAAKKIVPAEGVADNQKRTAINAYIVNDVIIPAFKAAGLKYQGEPAKTETKS